MKVVNTVDVIIPYFHFNQLKLKFTLIAIYQFYIFMIHLYALYLLHSIIKKKLSFLVLNVIKIIYSDKLIAIQSEPRKFIHCDDFQDSKNNQSL